MFKTIFKGITDFFRRQSENFKILMVQGILVGGGMREGVIYALTRQYNNLYIVALGASKVQLGLIQSIGTASRIALSVPIGRIIDRAKSLKKMLLLGMTIGFFSPLLYALALNWYMIVPAALIASLAWPLRGTVQTIFLTTSVEDADRATGFSVLTTIGAIPGILMPLMSAYLVETFGGLNVEGIRPLFFIEFILLVPVSLWVYWKLREPKRIESRKTISFLDSIKKFLIFDKGARAWLLVCIFDSFGMLAFPFLTVYAVEVKGANASHLAFMSIASTIASIIFTIPYGRLADRLGRKPVLYLGLIPTFAWMIFLIFLPSPDWLTLAGLFEGAFTATFPLWSTITMELVPEQLRGSYNGTRSMMTGISSMVAYTLAGILWETVSPSSIFMVALAFETVAITIGIAVPETLIKNRKEKIEPTPE